jgi:hypothetical protein
MFQIRTNFFELILQKGFILQGKHGAGLDLASSHIDFFFSKLCLNVLCTHVCFFYLFPFEKRVLFVHVPDKN